MARSWAPRTLVNGQPFNDAVLEPGDRLSVGPVEFEILASETPEPAPAADLGRTMVLDRRSQPAPAPSTERSPSAAPAGATACEDS